MVKQYRFSGIDCANCAAKLERALGKIDGVKMVSVQFMTQKLRLEIEDGRETTVLEEVAAVCRKLQPRMTVKAV